MCTLHVCRICHSRHSSLYCRSSCFSYSKLIFCLLSPCSSSSPSTATNVTTRVSLIIILLFYICHAFFVIFFVFFFCLVPPSFLLLLSHFSFFFFFVFLFILSDFLRKIRSFECFTRHARSPKQESTLRFLTRHAWSPKVMDTPPNAVCIYIYVYIYICCGVIIWAKFGLLRCYYLGQVCFFYKTLFVRKHYKIGVSALLFFEKELRAQIWGVIIWAKLVILKMQSTWPR